MQGERKEKKKRLKKGRFRKEINPKFRAYGKATRDLGAHLRSKKKKR